jgi:hypothetical protein
MQVFAGLIVLGLVAWAIVALVGEIRAIRELNRRIREEGPDSPS